MYKHANDNCGRKERTKLQTTIYLCWVIHDFFLFLTTFFVWKFLSENRYLLIFYLIFIY